MKEVIIVLSFGLLGLLNIKISNYFERKKQFVKANAFVYLGVCCTAGLIVSIICFWK